MSWAVPTRAAARCVLALSCVAPTLACSTTTLSPDHSLKPDTMTSEAPRFAHGVASGDPLSDRVIVWTRVTTSDERALDVSWHVATDPELEHVVAEGTTAATPARDFTVKVDVTGLEPGTTYYYRFALADAPSTASTIGRTRTLPSGTLEHLRLAVVSCSSYQSGFFSSYGDIATEDVDAVVHLGDYIYEYGPEMKRYDVKELGRTPDPPHEAITLEDYRTRYAQYHTDPDLQDVRAAHPLIAIWDDHEVADDVWNGGAANHNAGEGDFATRRAAAIEAYAEWMPVRETQRGGKLSLYRSFPFGDLADLVLVDTRLEDRDEPGEKEPAPPTSTNLGQAQEAWLHDQLSASMERGTTWRLFGSQVMMAQLDVPGFYLDLEAWDGFPAVRERLFDLLEAEHIDDVVVLSGDSHEAAAMEIARDPFSSAYDPKTGRGALMVELMTPSLTAPSGARFLNANGPEVVRKTHRHFKYLDLDIHGYLLVDVTRARVRGEWHAVDTLLEPNAGHHIAKVFEVAAGTTHLIEAR